MKDAAHAEWTKLRTTPAVARLVVTMIALTIGLGAAVDAAVRCASAGCDQDAVKISLTGVALGQAVVAILAVLVVSGEYGTGMIRITFTAMPRRSVVLAAKAITLAGVVFVGGAAASVGSIIAGRLILPARGFTRANGYS